MIRAGLLALLATASDATDPLAGRTPGEAVDCLELDRVQGPEIVDARTVLYRQSAARVWRMEPLGRCGGLTRDARLVTEISGRRMCRGDRFQVYLPDAPTPVSYCRSGTFTPFDNTSR